MRGPLDPSLIRDRAKVRTVMRWLAVLDAAGHLAALFAAPTGLSQVARDASAREEG